MASKPIPTLTVPEQVKLGHYIRNAVSSHERIALEKGYLKDLAKEVEEKFNFPTAAFNGMVSEAFEDKVSKTIDSKQEIVSAYEDIQDAMRNFKRGAVTLNDGVSIETKQPSYSSPVLDEDETDTESDEEE